MAGVILLAEVKSYLEYNKTTVKVLRAHNARLRPNPTKQKDRCSWWNLLKSSTAMVCVTFVQKRGSKIIRSQTLRDSLQILGVGCGGGSRVED